MSATATPPRSVTEKEYAATDNGDGTFTIHDVEIVGPMPAGHAPDNDGKAPATDRGWMERAVANHLAQLVAGYVAPVHDGHHGFTERSPIGTFVPMGVRTMQYEGDEIDVLMGDVTVDAFTLDEIQRGRWPYRSVEVARWSEAIITSLAFMSGAAPYWRFPMLRKVRVTNAAPIAPTLTEAALSAIAEAPRARGFRDATARLRARALARLEAVNGDKKKPVAKPEGDAPAKDEAQPGRDDATGEEAAPKWAAAIQQGIARLLEAILGKKTEDRVQPARDEDPNDSGEATADAAEETDEEDETDTPGAKRKGKGKENATMTAIPNAKPEGDTLAQLTALTGRVTALETANATLSAENTRLSGELASAKRASETKDFIAASRAQLRAKRVIVPTDFDATVAELYAAGKPLAEKHVATLAANGRMDPPERFTDEVGLSETTADDPAFTPFVTGAKNAPAMLEACRKAAAEFRAYKAQVPGSQLTLPEWLKSNVKVGA